MQHIKWKYTTQSPFCFSIKPFHAMKIQLFCLPCFVAFRRWMGMTRAPLAGCRQSIWHHKSISGIEAQDPFGSGLHVLTVCEDPFGCFSHWMSKTYSLPYDWKDINKYTGPRTNRKDLVRVWQLFQVAFI